ncbi:hypothetical protein LCGC14_1833240 [marine sediment metagenome]|uniref:Uncharacterized protein n=1 Tax=marine sediment metagenome TaxID=412755 RepID=A0A0F9JEX9_9ZZZZ
MNKPFMTIIQLSEKSEGSSLFRIVRGETEPESDPHISSCLATLGALDDSELADDSLLILLRPNSITSAQLNLIHGMLTNISELLSATGFNEDLSDLVGKSWERSLG